MRISVVVFGSLLLTASCGGSRSQTHAEPASTASSGSAAPSPAPAASLLPIVPMHLDQRDVTPPVTIAELRDDGSIYVHSRLAARIDGDRVLDTEGHVALEVAPDGTLHHDGRALPLRITERGDLVTEQGDRMEIGPDLAIAAVSHDGRRESYTLHFDAVPDRARRTAGVVLFFALASARMSDHVERRLAVPERTTAALEQNDTPLADGSVADDYRLTLRAGQTVTVVVRGGASTSSPGERMDMYTLLMSSGQEIVHDDDSAGNQNSRIIYTSPLDSDVIVRVTTYGAGLRTGAYEIETLDGAHPEAM